MDRKEFGNLILENERQLYRIAKSILRSDEDCADAAQETVMKAFEKLHTLRDDRYAKTWLIWILITSVSVWQINRNGSGCWQIR